MNTMEALRSTIADTLAEHMPEGDDGQDGGKNLAIADAVIAVLGLTQVWSDDVAGPDWQRYSYWRTPTVDHPGPSRLAAGLT
jgi:hypothetical protein